MRRPIAGLVLLLLFSTACSRPPGLFNGQNAHAHVEMLAGTIGSRPIGTAANARAKAYVIDQLRLFGFDVRVQDADGRRAGLGRTARVSNIIAVRPGRRSEAIALVSHYDSVPMGPGGADDALGVAVSLEAARVLAARADANWSLMVLVTDGEEAGLMGAAALMTDRDVTRQLHAYINLESIGAAGPPMLFEAGPGNDWILSAWTRHAPYPRGGSFVTEIYRRLPNDTDFSILKLHEIPGLNLAAVDDSYAYHTNRDTADRVAAETVRKSGEQLVALVEALDRTDITQRNGRDRTYFDIGGTAALSIGTAASLLLALGAVLFGVVAWVKALAASIRLEGLGRWLLTCFWILAGAALVVASMTGATSALRAAREVYHPWYAHPGRLFVLLAVVGATVGWSVARLGALLPARAHGVRHPIVVWSVTLPAWIALAVAAQWLVPGAAYLWILPLAVAGVLLSIVPAANETAIRVVSMMVLAAAGTLWLPNTHDLLRFAVAQLGRSPIVAPVFVFTAMMALAGVMVVPPLIAIVARTRPVLRPSLTTSLGLTAIAVAAGFAYAAPAYTEEAPLRRYARVIQEGNGAATWEVASIEPGIDLGEEAPHGWTAVNTAPPASVPLARLPHPFVFRASTPSLGPAPMTVASLTVEPVAAGTELAVTVVPRMPGVAISFVLPPGLEPARANIPGILRGGRWTATYIAPPPDGVVFRAAFTPLAATALHGLRLVATVTGSPGGEGWTAPPWLAAARTAWTAEASWIVAPFDLPIAPVPPLR
jgi:peptidase M28-like protein